MNKTQISFDAWKELEHVLMRHRIGYEIKFDDHNGTAEMLIAVQPIGVYRWEENTVPNEEVVI